MERLTVGEIIAMLQRFDPSDRVVVEVVDCENERTIDVTLDRIENNPGERCRVKMVCFDL